MSVSSQEYRVALDVQKVLVDAGLHPSVAGALVVRAVNRVSASGLGKIQPTRRVQRDLKPGLTPRYSRPTGRCTTFVEAPGQENETLVKIQEFESQGYNVIRTEPYPGHVVYYACPPGQMPIESQPMILQSEPA